MSAFWRLKGRPIDLAGAGQWLSAPMHNGQTIGDGWLQAAAATHHGTVREDVPGGGLLADMAQLDGPGFEAAELRPEIRDFYEHTSDWRMEVWTQWNPAFQPGGELVSRMFGRRVQQLALPTRPLDVAHGMDSRVAIIADADDEQRAAAWIRTLRSTGKYVYSGCYSTRLLPGQGQPSVHVAYVVVEVRGRTHAARAPIHESFRVYLDQEGVLRDRPPPPPVVGAGRAAPLQARPRPRISPGGGKSGCRRARAPGQIPGGRHDEAVSQMLARRRSGS